MFTWLIKCSRKYVIGIFTVLFILSISIIPYLFLHVQAAPLTSASDTISSSQAGATSVAHTFAFTTATTATIATITFQYCTTASGTCTAPTGLNITGGVIGTVSGIGAGTYSQATSIITYTVTSPASVTASTAISIQFTGITNPSTVNTTSYVRITTNSAGPTAVDTSTVAFAVLDTNSIAVTAAVDPNFTFSVAGVASTGTVNGATTTITTTTTTIPLGTLTSGAPAIGAHDLTVSTNASHGFQVTVNQSGTYPLSSGSDHFSPFSGTYATPTSWSAPAGTTANTNTAFFGYTTEDTTESQFQTNKWAGTETTSRALFVSTSGTTSLTKRIGWEAAVNAIQPPGSYTGTMILVATPTY